MKPLKILCYTPAKFEALSAKRQIQILLDATNTLENLWPDLAFRNPSLNDLQSLFLQLQLAKEHPLYKFSIDSLIYSDMTLPHFLNLIVPLERWAGREYVDHDFLVASKDKEVAQKNSHPVYVVLENIRSAFNVGSIFRSADCVGAKKIYLCGYTPTPEHSNTLRASLGAQDTIEWQHVQHITEVINDLRTQNIPCFGLETAQVSRSIYDFTFPNSCALFLGNERCGLQGQTLMEMDQILHIPTFGYKNSLNVGVCFGIASYEVLRQWN